MEIRRLIAASDEGLAASIPRLLFVALGAPVSWALHLLAVYFVQTMDCITAWDGSGWVIALLTVLAAAVALAAGWIALRLRRAIPDDEGNHWIGFVALLGIGGAPVFTMGIVLAGLAPAFVATCA